MTEIPSAFFLLLSIFFFWKGYVLDKGKKFLVLFAIFFAIACLTRFQYMMFAPPILLFIFVREKFKMLKNKNLWMILIIFISILIPFFILYSSHYGFFFSDIIKHYFGIGATNPESSAAAGKSFWNYFDYFKDFYYVLTKFLMIPFLIGVFYFFADLFLGIDKIFKSEKIQKIFFVFCWVVIPLIILGKITGLVEQRYTLPVLPFLFLMISTFFVKIEEIFNKHFKINKKIIFVLIFFILAGLMIPNVIFGKQLIDSKLTSYSEIKDASLWIKENSNPGDIIIGSSFPQISYYSERSISTFTEKGNPEDKQSISKEEFEQFVNTEKPRYLILYAYQGQPDWVPGYLKDNLGWKPVRAYPSAEQAILIIYELNN